MKALKRRDTKQIREDNKHTQFLSGELSKMTDETLKHNLLKHTQMLKKTNEQVKEDFRFNYNQQHGNQTVLAKAQSL